MKKQHIMGASWLEQNLHQKKVFRSSYAFTSSMPNSIRKCKITKQPAPSACHWVLCCTLGKVQDNSRTYLGLERRKQELSGHRRRPLDELTSQKIPQDSMRKKYKYRGYRTQYVFVLCLSFFNLAISFLCLSTSTTLSNLHFSRIWRTMPSWHPGNNPIPFQFSSLLPFSIT